MSQTDADVNLQLPGEFSPSERAEATEIFRREFDAIGLSVQDSGGACESFSELPPLDFVLALVHNPWVQSAVGTTIAHKVYDAVLDEVVKTTVGKLASAGKQGLRRAYHALSERFPDRRIQIAIETPNGVEYPVGPDDVEEQVPKIAYDFAKERSGHDPKQRIYFNGEWMTPEEYFAAFRAQKRAERGE